MAQNDIWRVRIYSPINDRATSFSLYYRETTSQTVDGFGDPICRAVQLVVGDALENVLSTDAFIPRIQAWRQNKAGIPGDEKFMNADGNIPTPALPANKCLLFRFFQNAFPAKHNNRIFISGCVEGFAMGNVWDNTFLTGVVVALRDALLAPLNEASPGSGVWTPACFVNQSAPFNDANYPPVIGIAAHPVIYSQKPRTRRSFLLNQ